MTPKDNTRNRCAEEKNILQHVLFKLKKEANLFNRVERDAKGLEWRPNG